MSDIDRMAALIHERDVLDCHDHEPGHGYACHDLASTLAAYGLSVVPAPLLDVDRLVDAIVAAEKATGWDLNVGEGPLAEAIAAAWERLPR